MIFRMSHYEILEVKSDATNDDIKKSYKRLAVKYHPDKTGGENDEIFKNIQKAYHILTDSDTRELYNKQIGIDRK